MLTGSPNDILLILAPLAGGVMLAYGAFQLAVDLRGNPRKKVIDRLKDDGNRRAEEAAKQVDFRRSTIDATGILAGYFAKMSLTQNLQRTLEQANLNWSAPQVLVNVTAAALVITAAVMFVGVNPLAAIGAGVAVFVLPIIWLNGRRKARLKKFVHQLPDVFEMLSQALRAGHSLASGMQLISRELPDPAGTEFGRVFHEQNLGLKVEDALKNMAERVDMLDVRFFVTAVLIQRQTGGDLAEVLDKIGKVIRSRIELFGKVQALTAEGRLSGYVLLALPGIVFAVMLQVNREYAMMLFTTDMGRMMLTASVVMQIMGWLMIKKIINIKV